MDVRVSVIVPVYNPGPYLSECLQSVADQTIDHEQLELIAVDDGSTDGSDRVLEEFASCHPWMVVLRQPNSGSPGGARNPALDRAVGEYVFFLDADDKIAPDALRRMAAVADREGSDIVFGKMAGLNGRKVPQTMFKKTQLDAPLLDSHVFRTLGPTKLLRRSMIEELGLRFPTDQKVGEDQPFMAAAYLNARKITLLADMDYYYARRRDDGGNITASTGSHLEDRLERAIRLTTVIVKYTEPGELRDGLLMRPFSWSLVAALHRAWLRRDREAQEAFAASAQDAMGPYYTEGVRGGLGTTARIELDLLFAGKLDILREFLEHACSGQGGLREWEGGAFRLVVPGPLRGELGLEQRAVPAPRMSFRLDELEASGTAVVLRGVLDRRELLGLPDEVTLRVTRRDRRESMDLAADFDRSASLTGRLDVSAVVEGLGPGTWDTALIVRVAEHERVIPLGKNRVSTVPPEGTSNLAEHPPVADTVVAYFRPDGGTLAIDRGLSEHPAAGRARVLGLTRDPEGRCVALVETTHIPAPGDTYFAGISGGRPRSALKSLETTRLGERLVGVKLPITQQTVGARIALSVLLGGVRSALPVAGTEYWPREAAGYDLEITADGGVAVTAVSEVPAVQLRAGAGSAMRKKLKALPLIGPALVRIAHRVRDR